MGETVQIMVAQAEAEGGMMSFFVMMIMMLAIFYFLLFRPQQKQQQKHQSLLSGLKRGDEVILSSGIIGKIHAVEENTVTMDLNADTRIKVLKRAVSSLSSNATGAGAKSLDANNNATDVVEQDEDKGQKAKRKGNKRATS